MQPFANQSVESTTDLSEPRQEAVVVPVIEEQLRLGKEVRETGTVRVSKAVFERQEIARGLLAEVAMEVERIPVNRVVSTVPETRVENGVTIISVVKEFAVVVKELRVVEEIRITQRRTETPFEHPVSLLSEQVVVERTPAGIAAPPDRPSDELVFIERAEIPVLSKEAVVVEEVSIDTVVTERVEAVRDTVRHTELEIEDLKSKQAGQAS